MLREELLQETRTAASSRERSGERANLPSPAAKEAAPTPSAAPADESGLRSMDVESADEPSPVAETEPVKSSEQPAEEDAPADAAKMEKCLAHTPRKAASAVDVIQTRRLHFEEEAADTDRRRPARAMSEILLGDPMASGGQAQHVQHVTDRLQAIAGLMEDFEKMMRKLERHIEVDEASFMGIIGSGGENFQDPGKEVQEAEKLLKVATKQLPFEAPKEYEQPSKAGNRRRHSEVIARVSRGSLERPKERFRRAPFELHHVSFADENTCQEETQVWCGLSLIHLAAYCLSGQCGAHIDCIMEAQGDVSSRASYEVQVGRSGKKAMCTVQAIHLAVYAGNIGAVKRLLELRASPEARTTFDSVPDFTPLHLAKALEKREEQSLRLRGEGSLSALKDIAQLLIDSKADLNAIDLSGCTPGALPRQGLPLDEPG